MISSENHPDNPNQITIEDPIAFVEFIHKSNINEKAKNPLEVMMHNKKSDTGLMTNTDDKVRAFKEFCDIAESKGLTVKDKEKVIEQFIAKENKIFDHAPEEKSSTYFQDKIKKNQTSSKYEKDANGRWSKSNTGSSASLSI